MRKTLAICALLGALALLSGCFTAVSRMGSAWGGGGPSLGTQVVCGALDIVTSPIQIVIFGPMIVAELIDENTGEHGRANRARREHEKAVQGYKDMLDADFGCVFMDMDFQCATNRAAMDALNSWLACYGIHRVPGEQVRPYSVFVLEHPDVFRQLPALWRQQAFDEGARRKAFDAAVGLCRADGDKASLGLVRELVGCAGVSDAELRGLAASSVPTNGPLAKVFQGELGARAERRRREAERAERERKRREEEAARRRQEAERQRRESEERRRKWEAHRKEMMPFVQSISEDVERFRPALAWCRDGYVADRWRSRLGRRAEPLPVGNLRLLAEEVLRPGAEVPEYVGELMERPEFTGEDLRRYYGQMLACIRGGWRTYCMARLLHNANMPADLVRASYDEPLLASFRLCYLRHRLRDAVPHGEWERIVRRTRELEGNRSLSPEKRAKALDREIQPFMPKACPADWLGCGVAGSW